MSKLQTLLMLSSSPFQYVVRHFSSRLQGPIYLFPLLKLSATYLIQQYRQKEMRVRP